VKTLHLYLTRQIVAALLMTVMVFTFVLLLVNALREILPWLVSGQVGFGVVATAFGLLVPFVWVFALPMGMLTATLLIFGRFSADQELTAVRASGVSLLSLISPILLLSLALCGVSAFVNMEFGPRCRVAYNALRGKLFAQFSSAQLPEGRFITDFPGYIFYIGKNRNPDLEDVLVFVLQNDTNVEQTVRAPRGRLSFDTPNKRLNLTLYDAKIVALTSPREPVASSEEVSISFEDSSTRSAFKPKIDDMTFTQLWEELRDLERRIHLPASVKSLTPEQRLARKKQLEQQRANLMPIIFQMHRQVAFSFACFGFTLLGIPLGIRVHRRETNIGIAIALLLVALYYGFILVGHALIPHPELAPYLFVWLPNLLFQFVGAVLLWRANRGI
jgi:lipopolysaccharide export system permease protein